MKAFRVLLLCSALLPVLKAEEGAKLIEVASFGKNQPIGMAAASNPQRIFVSFPRKEPYLFGLTEIVKGERVPFPDEAWNKYDPANEKSCFVNVQDLFVDRLNDLWVLDSAPAGSASIFGGNAGEGKFKLIRIDLDQNKVERVYDFPDLPKNGSALNDMCIDHTHQCAYLSDPGLKALIVMDLESGKSRVVLKDDPATVAAPGFVLHLDGKDVVDGNGKPFVSNVNGIALTKDDRYFYFRAINQTKLYRIETKYLSDASLPDQELSEKVETVADTGVCHGMIADEKGNVYLTDSAKKEIRYVTPGGEVKTLVQDDRLIWPDSLGIGSDGFLYLTASQIHRTPKYNGGEDRVEYPFRAYKVALPK
jgi:sugar lactone lactonase YvrE